MTPLNKLILVNDSDLSMESFMAMAQRVVKLGLISKDNKQYCYLSVYEVEGKEYHIVSDLNAKSHRLTIYKSKRKII